jgi:Ca2+-binding EF-hand superfamily protein
MLIRLTFLLAVAVATPAVAQSAPAKAAAKPAVPAAQPIPRATFLQNMDGDFGRMDANHDGKVTKQEIEASQQAGAMREIMARNRSIFVQLDKDHNGQLSAQEFSAFHANPPAPNATPMLQHFDANRDGTITQVEFRAGTLANFDRLDVNKDGVVDAAEMKAGGIIKK